MSAKNFKIAPFSPLYKFSESSRKNFKTVLLAYIFEHICQFLIVYKDNVDNMVVFLN